jgi:hypothetical protein
MQNAVMQSSLNRTDLFHQSPDFDLSFDLQGLITGRTQFINIKRTAGQNTLYLGLFNFEANLRRTQNIAYTILVNEITPA